MARHPFLSLEQQEDLAYIAGEVIDDIRTGEEYRSRRHWESAMRDRWREARRGGEFITAAALASAARGVGGEHVVDCLEFATNTTRDQWRAMRLAAARRASRPRDEPPAAVAVELDPAPRSPSSGTLERRTLLHRARLRLTDAEVDYVRAATSHLDAASLTERDADDAILRAVADVRDEPASEPAPQETTSPTGQRLVPVRRR